MQPELTFQTKAHILKWAVNLPQLSIHTYMTNYPAPFIVISARNEWHSVEFMFTEQLIHRFWQEVPIETCRISNSVFLQRINV